MTRSPNGKQPYNLGTFSFGSIMSKLPANGAAIMLKKGYTRSKEDPPRSNVGQIPS